MSDGAKKGGGAGTTGATCRFCRHAIPAGAVKCTHCESWQDWRSVLGTGNASLTALIALFSVTALLVSTLRGLFPGRPDLEASLARYDADAGVIELAVTNRGRAAGVVGPVLLELSGEERRAELDLAGLDTVVGPGATRILQGSPSRLLPPPADAGAPGTTELVITVHEALGRRPMRLTRTVRTGGDETWSPAPRARVYGAGFFSSEYGENYEWQRLPPSEWPGKTGGWLGFWVVSRAGEEIRSVRIGSDEPTRRTEFETFFVDLAPQLERDVVHLQPREPVWVAVGLTIEEAEELGGTDILEVVGPEGVVAACFLDRLADAPEASR